MTPADALFTVGLPLVGGGAAIVAQDAASPSALQVIFVAVAGMVSLLTLNARREERRAKAEEKRADRRDKLLENNGGELAKQTESLVEIAHLLGTLNEQQKKSDENRFHGLKGLNDKMDAMPERIEHRMRRKEP